MPSTVIGSFTYHADTQTLRIRFLSGMVYEYKNVPESVYDGMKNSRSKGIFFNQNIKDIYEFEKVGSEGG